MIRPAFVRAHRRFLFSVVCLLLLGGCTGSATPPPEHRVIVLGFDGVDPNLLERFMAEGQLPNFAILKTQGTFRPLATTIPPQSPVAWSTFITGQDPGGHGIYDFIHRDPAPAGGGAPLPFLSTSKVEEDEWRMTLGKYALPLRSGKTELLRKGKAFWNVLEEHGVPATVVKIPANFPPEPSRARTLSDMGTPDLRGTYGTFSFYSSDPADGGDRQVSGGLYHALTVRDDHARGEIPGPVNPFRSGSVRATSPFDVWRDPQNDAVKIEAGGEEIVLQRGEWSGWVPVEFPLHAGMASVQGIVRFHLVETRPYLRLYTSPVNIDPADPALPISTPPEYAQDLFQHVGRFYTQGLPENTAALTADALDDARFLSQADDIYGERMRLLEVELGRFRGGLLFVYFGGTDQVAHMFWRTLDRTGEDGQPVPNAGAILATYRQVDVALGRVMKAMPDDTTLIVMSDHGFAPFARAVHLNSWLRDEGFLRLRGKTKVGGELFRDVDWSRTRAYGLGLNGLYLNVQGRETLGVVGAAERDAVLAEITAKLLEWRDPDTGEVVVSKVYRREEVYSGPYRDLAPDLVVGYNRGYRVSNESALGEAPEKTVEDNLKKWSGDHCIAADIVPGVLLTNRQVASDAIGLVDLAPTILAELGVAAPREMTGKSFLKR